MVLTDALCYINLASTAMMNGVCCYYQMQEEKQRQQEHQDAIRRAIREEWDRNRMYEEHRSGIYYPKAVPPATDSQWQQVQDRRSQLMQTKQRASSDTGVGTTVDDRRSDAATSAYSEPLQALRHRSYEHAPATKSSNRHSSANVVRRKRSYQSTLPTRQMSSLLDDEDDDDDDIGNDENTTMGHKSTGTNSAGIGSLEDIALE